MKNFLVCILIIATFPAFGQRVADSIFKLKLTEKEKQNYVLNIDQSKITKSRDTIVFWGKKNYSYVIVPVKLSNLSNNTLIYINMTCSTYDIFTVNNKDIELSCSLVNTTYNHQ